MIDDHRPWPGPDYWDFLCVVCSEPVEAHGRYWRGRFRRVVKAVLNH